MNKIVERYYEQIIILGGIGVMSAKDDSSSNQGKNVKKENSSGTKTVNKNKKW